LLDLADASTVAVVESLRIKQNAADLSGGVFAILISVNHTQKYQIHYRSTNIVKNWQTVM